MGLTRIRARRLRSARGMAMVEMVLVLPLLLLLLFGIAEVSLLFSRWITMINAVHEGTRFAVVYRAPCDPATVINDTKQRVQDYASAGGLGLSLDRIDVERACIGPDTEVSAEFDFAFSLLPGLTRLFGSDAFPATIPLSYVSTMRNEND